MSDGLGLSLTDILLPFGGPDVAFVPASAATIDEVVYAVLSGDSQTVAVVGDRISPDLRPQTEGLPAIRFVVSEEDGLQSLDGLTGDYDARVEVEAVATDRLTCRRLTNRIRRLLPGAEGKTILGLRVKRVNFESDESDCFPLSDGADRPVRSMASTFVIQYWDL